MEKISKKALAGYIIAGLIAVADILNYIITVVNLRRNFLYFYFTSVGRFVFYSIMMLLPFFAGTAYAFFAGKTERKGKTALICTVVLSVILSFIFTVFMGIMTPCGSKTEDLKNYLVFDKNSIVISNGMFPEKIPDKAENIKYYYNFVGEPDIVNEVYAEWRLPRDEYEAEKKRLREKFSMKNSEQIANYVLIYISDEDKTDYDYNFYAYNDTSFTIRYVSSYIQNIDVNGIEPYYATLKWS